MATSSTTMRFTPHDLEALDVIQDELGVDRTSAVRVSIHEKRRLIEAAKAAAARVPAKKRRGAAGA